MFKNKNFYWIGLIILGMLVFFLLGKPALNDDGFQYEGFAESLAQGHLDFKSYYGFQGLSFFAALIYLLTHSHISIIITSMIFSIFSIPLAYFCAKSLYSNSRPGIYGIIIFLLTPYPYVTLMRGFQEAALLFFILLILYGTFNKKAWTPLAWAIGGIVKPFALILFPLFINLLGGLASKRRLSLFFWLFLGLFIGGLYLAISYHQTGHLINNAAINSYQGNFNTGNPPPLTESFGLTFKGFARAVANLLISSRKIVAIPLLILLGAYELWYRKNWPWRWPFIISICLNLILVGLLTFSFSKYLIPAAVLLSLASLPVLIRYRWLMILVFINAWFVFLPIWNYFGKVFWTSLPVFMLPFWIALVIYIYDFFRYGHTHSNPE